MPSGADEIVVCAMFRKKCTLKSQKDRKRSKMAARSNDYLCINCLVFGVSCSDFCPFFLPQPNDPIS
jgi:hypothetical protein